jgi:hypothetical protein
MRHGGEVHLVPFNVHSKDEDRAIGEAQGRSTRHFA